MFVLKNPKRFGLLFLFCVSLLLNGMELGKAIAEQSAMESSVHEVVAESQPDSTVNSSDPPLLDLSDFLSELGELPTLEEAINTTVGMPECDSPTDINPVKLTGGIESDTETHAAKTDTIGNPQNTNPLRIGPRATTRPTTQSSKPAPKTLMPAKPAPISTDNPKPVEPEAQAKDSTKDADVVSKPSSTVDDACGSEGASKPQSPSEVPQRDLPLVLGLGDGAASADDSSASEMHSKAEPPRSEELKSEAKLPSDPPTLELEKDTTSAEFPTEDEVSEIHSEMADLIAVPMDSLILDDTPDESSGRSSGESKAKSHSTRDEPHEVIAEATKTKPKPRIVKLKKLTDDDQEAPSLENVPREADSKQAQEEDSAAVEAKRPQASKKSFVESENKRNTIAAPTLSPAESLRQQRVENCLAYYIANPETVVERSPWAVMHAMLPFGVEGEVIVGNKRVNSIQWMCYNGTCRTQKMFTPAGRSFRPNVGGGVQGHEGQFLAMLAQSQVSTEYPIVVNNKRYTVQDLVRYEMATCKEKTELTFKLISLSYYVDTAQSWTAADRRKWNIQKLVEEELAQPVVGAACGGTHRLMGLTFALRQRKAEGRPIDGNFARAEKYVADYVDYTWKLQNPDGSFSSNWFESRGHEQNKERLVQTSGHILEWLMFTLPKNQLDDPRVIKSVDFLLSHIWDERQHKWPVGPRGHATRAIALYQQRVYGGQPGQRHVELAKRIESLKLRR